MRLVLVGMKGVGKTTIGKKLAESWQIPFVDTDVELERRWQQLVREMFLSLGETGFRKREQEILQSISGPAVIAVGGGTYLDPDNRNLLQSLGPVVCLHLPKEDLRTRWVDMPASCLNFNDYYQERLYALSQLSCFWLPASDGAYLLLLRIYGE